MRIGVVLIGLVFLFGCTSVKKLPSGGIQNEQELASTKAILSKLSSDEFEGRKPGTGGFELAATYAEEFLAENKISPFYGDSYRDSVVVRGEKSYNIVALIGDGDRTKKHILIGAHIDHLGKNRYGKDSVFNGANDNASGVTAVLQIAKQLRKQEFDQNIIIALFTGEEIGLLGSKHLAKRMKSDSVNLSYMLNFEMIGVPMSDGDSRAYITGYSKSNFAEVVGIMADSTDVELLQSELSIDMLNLTSKLFFQSDNYSFYQEFGVPCHTISTFIFSNYSHYHKKSDEVEELDIEHVNTVITRATFVIRQLLINDIEVVSAE